MTRTKTQSPTWRVKARELKRELDRAVDRIASLQDELEQRDERATLQYRELEARYSGLLAHVAERAALEPPVPIVIAIPDSFAATADDPDNHEVLSEPSERALKDLQDNSTKGE